MPKVPSTRTLKAKRKRPRQSDLRYDSENMDVMLGFCPKMECVDHQRDQEIVDLEECNELQQNANPMGKDFRYLLNTNSRISSEIVINSAITENILSILQNSLETQENGFSAKVCMRSSGLHRKPKVENNRKTQKNCSEMNSNQIN